MLAESRVAAGANVLPALAEAAGKTAALSAAASRGAPMTVSAGDVVRIHERLDTLVEQTGKIRAHLVGLEERIDALGVKALPELRTRVALLEEAGRAGGRRRSGWATAAIAFGAAILGGAATVIFGSAATAIAAALGAK